MAFPVTICACISSSTDIWLWNFIIVLQIFIISKVHDEELDNGYWNDERNWVIYPQYSCFLLINILKFISVVSWLYSLRQHWMIYMCTVSPGWWFIHCFGEWQPRGKVNPSYNHLFDLFICTKFFPYSLFFLFVI